MNTREYPYHAPARSSMRVVGVLLCITVIGLPFGIYVLYRAATAKLVLGPNGVTARSMTTVKVDFADVTRYGVLAVPLRGGGGIGGAIGRERVGGGSHAYHLCFMTRAGKTVRFMVSTFEQHEEITQTIARRLQRTPEDMIMGGFGPSWPKTAAAA